MYSGTPKIWAVVIKAGYQIGAVIARDGNEAFSVVVNQISKKIESGEIDCVVDTIEKVMSVHTIEDREDVEEDEESDFILEELRTQEKELQKELEIAQQPYISMDMLLRMNHGMAECK